MTSKPVRIAKQLIEAKGKGVLEVDLLTDFERRANTRKIKQRVNDIFGDRHAVTVENGYWKLDEQHWDVKPKDLNIMLLIYEMTRVRNILFWSITLAVTTVFFLGFIIGSVIQFEYA